MTGFEGRGYKKRSRVRVLAAENRNVFLHKTSLFFLLFALIIFCFNPVSASRFVPVVAPGSKTTMKLKSSKVTCPFCLAPNPFPSYGIRIRMLCISLYGNPPERNRLMGIPVPGRLEETDEMEPNMVLREFQKGYFYKDRLLRPAKVIVSKSRE